MHVCMRDAGQFILLEVPVVDDEHKKNKKGNKVKEWSVSSTWGLTCRYLNIPVIITVALESLLLMHSQDILPDQLNNVVVVTRLVDPSNVNLKTILLNVHQLEQ